ncbi:MAG: sugar transferase [Firmicutes bacterium]|nr:sugar transferase [Bacillota bacterium]
MKWEKRVFDLICSILGLIMLTPFLLVIAVLIKLGDGGPVFFYQERVGCRGRLFRICKFRTMIPSVGQAGGQLTVGNDSRVTRIGYLLRKTKLDELPQLINVLVGEMSLVGPRPEVPRYVAFYNQEQREVLNLMPGITDLASIKYRDESSLLAQSADPEKTYIQEIMPRKIQINLAYARDANLLNDIGVIISTFAAILKIH